jgi:hypothetical protein
MRQARVVIVIGLAAVLVGALLVWRLGDWDRSGPASSWTASSSVIPTTGTAGIDTTERSPLAIVPTVLPPVSAATLEAIRTTRPTATPPARARIEWPYISPDVWRAWALRLLAAAGLFGYIGLRLRDRQ